MAEAIISRRGYGPEGKPELKTEIISSNQNWVVPKHFGNISVRIFGGGGGSNTTHCSSGGGGGWMNNGEVSLTVGNTVFITIGQGGISGSYNSSAGGTTSFGTYLSANGGEPSDQWNGGGNGGSGGGGHASYTRTPAQILISSGIGGIGYQFGGGGSCGGDIHSSYNKPHSNGGPWGGGGGKCGITYWSNSYFYTGGSGWSNTVNSVSDTQDIIGGIYGGNAGGYNENGEDGTNTINYNFIPNELQGSGKGSTFYSYNSNVFSGGSGGGYGGNGGYPSTILTIATTSESTNTSWGANYTTTHNYYCIASGGGGGYGGNGGNGGQYGGGGGGGYGGNGGDGWSGGGGGGGGYGDGASQNKNAGYGGGGSGYFNGGSGVCIIQYYG